MNRILYRTLNKDPEKNDKQMMKIKNLIMKVFNALEEWSDYIVLYLKEYKKTHITKQNERLLKEIIDNISPILLNERDLFNIKVLDIKNEDINEIESPELKKNEKIVKIEEGVTVLSVLKGSKKREASQGKYRDLSYEEKIPFIKCGLFFS